MRRLEAGRMRPAQDPPHAAGPRGAHAPPGPSRMREGNDDQQAAAKRSATFDQFTTFHHASR